MLTWPHPNGQSVQPVLIMSYLSVFWVRGETGRNPSSPQILSPTKKCDDTYQIGTSVFLCKLDDLFDTGRALHSRLDQMKMWLDCSPGQPLNVLCCLAPAGIGCETLAGESGVQVPTHHTKNSPHPQRSIISHPSKPPTSFSSQNQCSDFDLMRKVISDQTSYFLP